MDCRLDKLQQNNIYGLKNSEKERSSLINSHDGR